MNIKQLALDLYAKIMQAKQTEAETKVEATEEVKPEIPVKLAEEAAPADAPAADAKDEATIEQRVADLETAIKQVFEMIDKLGAPKEDVEMSKQIEGLKTEIEAQKAELEKFAAQPDGKVAKKKKEVKTPEIEHAGLKRLLA